MTPETQPLRITIVDMFGSFLPGMAWIVLLLTVLPWLLGQEPRKTMSPLRTVAGILAIGITGGNSPSSNHLSGGSVLINRASPTSAYVFLAVGALLIGFLLKGVVMRIAERIARPDAVWHWLRQRRRSKAKYQDFIFPYNNHLSKQDYLGLLKERFHSFAGVDYARLPALQPFSGCKRILQHIAPGLWEELEHAEAEARMVGSLLIASVVSVLLGVAAGHPRWYLTSFAFTLILVFLFRTRRKREVNYCYLNFLIATGLQRQRKELSAEEMVRNSLSDKTTP